MTPLPLPADDCPLPPTTEDVLIRRQLERSLGRHFFEACSGSLQSLLMECGWTIRLAEALTLVLHCPDAITNWRVLNRLSGLAEPLAQFSPLAKIRVYPPGTGHPFEMRVNERGEFRDGPKPIY